MLSRKFCVLLNWIILLSSSINALADSSSLTRTEANVPTEITFIAQKPHDDPFNTVQVDVLFTDPKGGQKLVPAFWDGDFCRYVKTDIWKVRYSSPLTGKHTWRTQCNDASDAGLNGVSGVVKVSSYAGSNPLFKHGQLQVAPDKRHLQHADGTKFFWLGDTWWMGLCNRLHFPDEFKELAADRKEKGFTVIQMVAGLYPDMYPFDPRGANEAGFPWETNYTSIRPQYFDAADKRINYLVEQGLTPCIVGMWGYFLPMMGEQRAKQHWRELIARYGASPVVWCVAGEANLSWYQSPGFPYSGTNQNAGWTEVTRYIRQTDPFHRLVTIHPTGIGKQNSRDVITEAGLLDIDMLQTPHGQREAIAPTLKYFTNAYALPPMPVVNGEASYEMLNEKIAARWPRAMFWLCMINGAAGHTYGANGIWQCNRPEKPHGPSPTAGSPATGYGITPWNEAMHFPGSKQIGLAKKFLEKFPWERCKPMAESVSWGEAKPRQWGNWIWFPGTNPKQNATMQPLCFRREFDLDAASRTEQATLRVAADDKATIWVNGTKIGVTIDYQAPGQYDVTKLLRRGKNILAIKAENLPAPVAANPASLLAILEMRSKETNRIIISDANWRVAALTTNEWWATTFDDSKWTNAKVVAAFGEPPWKKFDDEDASVAPYALGIGDELRIVYAIAPRPFIVQGLRPKSRYRLTQFNPISGETKQTGSVTADANGEWQSPAPLHFHDWIVAMERVR